MNDMAWQLGVGSLALHVDLRSSASEQHRWNAHGFCRLSERLIGGDQS